MSFATCQWVVKHCKYNGSKKLAMMILAFHADDNGECFPSLETLASEFVVNERQARLILRQLEKLGEIEIVQGGGRRTNTYRLLGYIKQMQAESAPHKVQNPPSKGGYATPVIHNPPQPEMTQNNLSEGLQITPLNEANENPQIPKITPLGGDIQPLWGVTDNPSGGLQITPELKYNIHTTNIEPKDKNIVAPNGDDSAPAFADVPIPPSATSTGEVPDTPPVIEDTAPLPDNPTTAATPPKRKIRKRPATPVSADDPTPKQPSEHQQMMSAIVKAFGWSFETMTTANKSLVGKVAKELREAGGTPDVIPPLYEYCLAQNWSGKFTPMAFVSQWANFNAQQQQDDEAEYLRRPELRPWVPPEGYVGFKYDYPKPPTQEEIRKELEEEYGILPGQEVTKEMAMEAMRKLKETFAQRDAEIREAMNDIVLTKKETEGMW